jgi:predicted ATPase
MQAHHAAWGGPFDARYEEDLAHIERGLTLYDPAKHHAMSPRFGGHDAGVCGFCHAALALWATGYPDQAKEKNRQALALAQQLNHLPSLSHARNNAAWINYYARNWAEVCRFAETAIEAGRDSGVMFFTHQALALRGRALVELGEADAGLAAIDDNQVRLRAIQSGTALSFFTALYAEASAAVGRAEEALALLDQALEFSRRYEARAWEPNTHRLRGEVLLTLTGDRQAEAEACFEEAIAVAREHGAKMWELLAATSLARLWHGQGKTTEAHDLLALIYDWFTEGFDTADLKAAKALLNELT